MHQIGVARILPAGRLRRASKPVAALGEILTSPSWLRSAFHAGDRTRATPSHAGRCYLRTSAWNASVSRLVIGPGTPDPTLRPSISTTGMISAAVPVRKHSSAV